MEIKTKLATTFTALVLMSASSLVQADTIYGLYVDANYWKTDISGSNEEGKSIDYENKNQIMLSASLEHGVPLVPNLRGKYTQLNSSRNFDIEASSTDLLAYYEILDNVVSVDIGAGAKVLSSTVDNEESTRETLGLIYASIGAELPFTGLSAKAEASVGKNDELESSDVQAEIKYKFIDNLAVDVGAKVGYRSLIVDFTEDDADTKFTGPYLGVEAHF